MKTDTSEAGLESIIVRDMLAGGWIAGQSKDYDRTFCVDLIQLQTFMEATQPETAAALDLGNDSPTRRQFLARLEKDVSSKGVIEVLRNGVKHGVHDVTLFYGTPSPDNDTAVAQHTLNRFSVTRQLRYSRDETRLALDMALFINGLPVVTFELKNSLTKQTVADAVEQYKRDRDAKEPLFRFGRCVVHLAVDDTEVRMCTELRGKGSWFLPFNKGWNHGAGNPPNPNGLKTAYLWQDVLAPVSLTDILENYAQITEEKDRETGKKKRKQIFPRYHQLDAVRTLLGDARENGVGRRYLIQHSAGSGKSNTIAWTAHQLVGLQHGEKNAFDTVIVITDRKILDQQIDRTIRQFMQVGATVGHADKSGDLRRHLRAGKKIIISTVQKFPFILDELAGEGKGKRFAIIIDEAHSSQGGKTMGAMHESLSDPEDTVNDALEARMKARKMLSNASYFAFTATPKNKTLEMFGEPEPQSDGRTKHLPFHGYTMKQAVQEGFILDVLANYTPVESYYKLIKTVEDDPEFDTKKAKKKLRAYVEGHEHAVRLKAEIMVDHFHEQVIGKKKIGGDARAMVVCGSIERAVQYYHAIGSYLLERKSPYQAIVAFSGEKEWEGEKVSEASLNGFSSNKIAEQIRKDPYRFLVCADKFQTGYDEPFLHTMYVDKPLSGIKAVQTLSRLNRAHPTKRDVFVLDFQNDTDVIQTSFADYYRTTVLSEETDPNKLHDLQHDLDGAQVYAQEQVDEITRLVLEGSDRDMLDPILDGCVATYLEQLDEDGQVDFKGKAKSFVRTYDFLSSLLPYEKAEWEKRSILLTLLVPKLPAPVDEDLAAGILESIDMDSYRVEKRSALKVNLPDDDAEIGPVPVTGGGRKSEPELDRLSSIIKTFNDQFGTLFEDGDRILEKLSAELRPAVQADEAFINAQKNTPQTARLEGQAAIKRLLAKSSKDDLEFYRQYMENESFRQFVDDFALRSDQPSTAA